MERNVELSPTSVHPDAGQHSAVGWGGVGDMTRYLLLWLRAKATSFPQFIHVNGLRLRHGIHLKDVIPPFQCTVNFQPRKTRRLRTQHVAVLINDFLRDGRQRIL